MSRGTAPEMVSARRHRADVPGSPLVPDVRRLAAVASALIVAAFTLPNAGSHDLGPAEARLGMAAGDRVGPFGLVFGAWEPALLPGRVLPCQLWAWGYGGVAATAAAVRWPLAIASALLGLLAVRRAWTMLGPRASILAALTMGGSIALIDRSAVGFGAFDSLFAGLAFGLSGNPSLLVAPIAPDVNLIAGLCAVSALDRLLRRGPDLTLGLFAGLGFLAGGWPVLAVVALPSVVLPRREGSRTGLAVFGALAVVIAWSSWALSNARVEAWAASLALPLTKGPAWTLIPWVAAFALPWSPFAILLVFRSVRGAWSEEVRSEVMGWLKVVAALAMAGTLIPGLGDACRVPMLFGLALASAAALDRVLGSLENLGTRPRRLFWTVAIATTLAWAAVSTPLFGYVAAAIGAYRVLAVALVAFGLIAPIVAGLGLARHRPALGLAALVIVAASLKVAHWGIYVPEWNYRASQGPWGRAIGQWMPRRATLYFINTTTFDDTIPDRDRWPADLAFHVGRSVRQLPAAEALDLEPASETPHFVLLHPSEFEHWPPSAPPIVHVRTLQDRSGEPRVLARTPGPLYPDRRTELGE